MIGVMSHSGVKCGNNESEWSKSEKGESECEINES